MTFQHTKTTHEEENNNSIRLTKPVQLLYLGFANLARLRRPVSTHEDRFGTLYCVWNLRSHGLGIKSKVAYWFTSLGFQVLWKAARDILSAGDNWMPRRAMSLIETPLLDYRDIC